MVAEIGLTLSAIAFIAVSLEFSGQPLYWAPVFRIITLVGEMLYFSGLMDRIGTLLFLGGAVITVILWFRRPYGRSHQKSLIEVIELVAWLWMALAIH